VVIPVLVGGAALPRASELPEPLRLLVERQAATITTNSFRTDVAGLTRDIRAIAGGRAWGWAPAGIGALVLIAGLVLVLPRLPLKPGRDGLMTRTEQAKPANAGTAEAAKHENPANAMAEAHVSTGMQHYRNGVYDAAISEFSHAIDLEPRHPFYYKLRGDVYKAQGRMHRAFADYVRARQLRRRERLGYGQ
jgi:TolA-binding protein